MGFSIRKAYANKNKHTKEITSQTFVCYKEESQGIDKRDPLVKNPRQEVRCGYGARFSIKLDRISGKYIACDFVEHHNHDLVPQDRIYMLPSQRQISTTQAIEVELTLESGIRLRSAYELFVQLDCEEQISNIFWADTQMIMDYAQFGDVVTFDTTYKLNNEHKHFGSFVEFNHHRETVIFSAALMYDETVESFTWLFQIFLEAMSNKAPKTIFTYQDAAIAKAIPIVIPDTNHRLFGMSTTQLSKSFNAFLMDYLNCDHNLMEFFMHFERVLYEKRYKELEAEYNLSQKLPKVSIPTLMLEQVAEIYTKTIFEEFQNEYVQSIETSIIGTIHDGESTIFTIRTVVDGKKR
ncbi:protein FAR1-RELATED SEQUENCE 5-like [Camellia sinensis]|uniref:protein FAR1-RELATED SEQUENCE 5-like n=1 Tax=Camellia sinensis TaxID=4442 RepID=UPI0010358EF4|nr:protein FAR1-RELATED SEQUENCE 5-like [Camellia sinensis]